MKAFWTATPEGINDKPYTLKRLGDGIIKFFIKNRKSYLPVRHNYNPVIIFNHNANLKGKNGYHKFTAVGRNRHKLTLGN